MASGAEGDEAGIGRATAVALSLMVGLLGAIGVLAYGRQRAAPGEPDALVYPDADACAREGRRSAADCLAAYARARAAYPRDAPRYADRAACEAHHGAGHCLADDGAAGGRVAAADPGTVAAAAYRPRMAGFALAPSPGEDDAAPVYEHAPAGPGGHAILSGGGGYCTGSGARVVPVAAGASAARVSGAGRTRFGGFGGTGRSFGAVARGG